MGLCVKGKAVQHMMVHDYYWVERARVQDARAHERRLFCSYKGCTLCLSQHNFGKPLL